MTVEEKDVLNTIKDACEDKKGLRVRVLDLRGLTDIADYFVIANGNNINQVQAMADHVTEKLYEQYRLQPRNTEGYRSGNWVLIDYENVVVHIFDTDSRSFYNLDRIWSDAKEIEL